jgi:hypothetical protein
MSLDNFNNFDRQTNTQSGGFVKGQKSSVDPRGYRIFNVYTIVDVVHNPLYIDDDPNKGMKKFKGKSPKEVAKKVVTDICQMMKKSDPAGYKRWCRFVTSTDITKREKELLSIEKVAVKDSAKADALVDWNRYPGFQFILEDSLNMTSDGTSRKYMYYGERIKLDEAKKFKGKKFLFESQVIPIRKDYTLVQALLDHIHKSDKAVKRYKNTLNFAKHRSRSKSGVSTTPTVAASGGSSKSKSDNSIHNKLIQLTVSEVKRKCSQKGKTSWKVNQLNEVLKGLNLSRSGTKAEKCTRIIQYHQLHHKK